MQEELIGFEVAKLAKEKGFNIPSHSYYFEDGEFKEFEINDTYGYYGVEYTVNKTEFYNNWNDKLKTTKQGDRCLGCDNNPKYLETFSAPTQSLLQKWLRENHKIFIDCSHSRINDDGEVTLYQTQITSVSIGESYNFKHHKESNDCYGETYEEALEKGLQEALKLIKNEEN